MYTYVKHISKCKYIIKVRLSNIAMVPKFLRQGCGPSVIRLTSFLWVWFQCVCPLMPSYNTYHLTWISLTLAWDISSQLLQQGTAAVPYLGWGVSPYRRHSWPSTWDSSSRPSCACSHHSSGCSSQPPALASGVGGSSQLLPLALDSGWLLKVPTRGLGSEVASCLT